MKIVELPGFTVVGISARTNNATEMSSGGIIGASWMRFMSEGILNSIPNRADSNVVAMYTDYASDVDGDYTFLLGAKVNSARPSLPPGMAQKQVPAGRYAVLTSERGHPNQVVPNVWKKVWKTPSSVLGGERSYLADFEVYDGLTADPHNMVVEVWLGIR